jgi:hypothetical protein
MDKIKIKDYDRVNFDRWREHVGFFVCGSSV